MSSKRFAVFFYAAVVYALPLPEQDNGPAAAETLKRTVCVTVGGNSTSDGNQNRGELPQMILIKTMLGNSFFRQAKYHLTIGESEEVGAATGSSRNSSSYAQNPSPKSPRARDPAGESHDENFSNVAVKNNEIVSPHTKFENSTITSLNSSSKSNSSSSGFDGITKFPSNHTKDITNSTKNGTGSVTSDSENFHNDVGNSTSIFSVVHVNTNTSGIIEGKNLVLLESPLNSTNNTNVASSMNKTDTIRNNNTVTSTNSSEHKVATSDLIAIKMTPDKTNNTSTFENLQNNSSIYSDRNLTLDRDAVTSGQSNFSHASEPVTLGESGKGNTTKFVVTTPLEKNITIIKGDDESSLNNSASIGHSKVFPIDLENRDGYTTEDQVKEIDTAFVTGSPASSEDIDGMDSAGQREGNETSNPLNDKGISFGGNSELQTTVGRVGGYAETTESTIEQSYINTSEINSSGEQDNDTQKSITPHGNSPEYTTEKNYADNTEPINNDGAQLSVEEHNERNEDGLLINEHSTSTASSTTSFGLISNWTDLDAEKESPSVSDIPPTQFEPNAVNGAAEKLGDTAESLNDTSVSLSFQNITDTPSLSFREDRITSAVTEDGIQDSASTEASSRNPTDEQDKNTILTESVRPISPTPHGATTTKYKPTFYGDIVTDSHGKVIKVLSDESTEDPEITQEEQSESIYYENSSSSLQYTSSSPSSSVSAGYGDIDRNLIDESSLTDIERVLTDESVAERPESASVETAEIQHSLSSENSTEIDDESGSRVKFPTESLQQQSTFSPLFAPSTSTALTPKLEEWDKFNNFTIEFPTRPSYTKPVGYLEEQPQVSRYEPGSFYQIYDYPARLMQIVPLQPPRRI